MATYYVDATSGSDSANGTSDSTPWQTIAKVNESLFLAGDSILFKKGETWLEQLTVPSSGSEGNPITFGAYWSGDNPQINGANLVTGTWTAAGQANTWQIALVTEPKVVAFNGTPGNKVTSVVEIISEGEWYWESNILSLYSIGNPSTTYTSPGIEGGSRYNAILLNGKNHLIFQNLTVTLSNQNGINHSNSANSNITINNCTLLNNGGTGVSAYTGSTNWTISNNTITGNGQALITEIGGPDNIFLWTGTSGFNIFENTITNCKAGSGILLNGSGHNVYQNTMSGSDGYTIEILGTDNNVYSNTVTGTDRFGAIVINCQEIGPGNRVYRNMVYENLEHGILVEHGDGQIISYNIIYGHTGHYGIYIEAGYSNNHEIYNNTIYGNARGIQNDSSTGILIRNNLIFSNTAYGIRAFGTQTITNNNVWNNATANYSGITDQTGSNGNISADPLVVSTSAYNFHLQSTSPNIDAGVDVGLTTDYSGNVVPNGALPDIGAYEWLFVPICYLSPRYFAPRYYARRYFSVAFYLPVFLFHYHTQEKTTMSQLLKQSTAYTFQLGPFVDSFDGVTPKTSLTIAATDVDLSQNGGAFADKHDGAALTGTGDSQGYYDCVLDTTDTGTLGKLEVRCYVSGALPVLRVFQVVPAHVYDGLVAGTDNLQVDMVQLSGTAQTPRDIGANVLLSPGTGTGQISLTSGAVTAGTVSDKTGYSLTATTGLGNQTANITGNLSGSVGSVTGAVGSVGTAGISSNSFAAGAINAAVIANGAIDAATFAADVDAEILSYLVDDATRIDASALNTASVTSIPAILEDTGTTLPASLAAIEADTQDLQTQIGTDGAGLTAIPYVSSVNDQTAGSIWTE